ncbi:DPCD_family protein [Hexamita inflata]|uniref:Protein DPCD n=1 Tax=Hexamita inflata TaxID=28002 RepID=A0AA86RVM0_9EUKA|nr:DPCD family protein [Hexamita inflata]
MSLIPPGGKKQAWYKEGIQRIHTIMPDQTECIEEFDIKENICVARKWRRVDKLGRISDWDFEIGELPQQQQDKSKQVTTDLFAASNQPVITRHDSEGYYLFKITQMPWPESNYQVTAEDNQLVVRTANKKFYKKLTITDLDWQKIQLVNNFIKFKSFNNTLVIFYQKPPSIIAFEKAAKGARSQNIKEGGEGCRAE